jgi:hypothetical protein
MMRSDLKWLVEGRRTLAATSFPATSLLLAMALSLAMAIACPGLALAQSEPTVHVTLDPPVTPPASMVRYTVQVTSEGNHQVRLLRDASAPNMQIVGRSNDTQISITHGVAHRTFTLTYSLRVPDAVGTYPITAPLLQVGSERITPETVELRVVPGNQVPQASPTSPTARKDLFVAITRSPERPPYVGEQVLVTYDLMVDSRQMRVRPRPPSDPPLDAFWVEELSQHVIGRRQYVQQDGRTWEKTPLRVLALFPLRPGPAVIDAMIVPTARGGVFGWTDDEDIVSEELVLDVQPLPPGAPENFGDGNVGRWNFAVRADTRVGRVGETLTLTAVAEGDGRPNRVAMPPFPATDGLRFVSVSDETEQNVQGMRLTGRKIARYAIMPTREGLLTIPPLTFAYFDPDAGEYRTISSQPITIRAEPGDLPAEPAPEQLDPQVARNASNDIDVGAALRRNIAPLEPVDTPATERQDESGTHVVFALLAGLPLLGLLAVAFAAPLRRRFEYRQAPTRVRKKAHEEVQGLLEQARTAHAREGHELLLRAIRYVMVDVLDVPPGAVTESELPPALRARQIPEETATRLSRILGTCTRARFAPSPGASVDPALIDECANVLAQAIEKAPARQKASAPTLLVMTVLLALLVPGAFSSIAYAGESEPDLLKAVTLAEGGDWTAAAAIFDVLAERYPHDSRLAYNAGTAHLQAGRLPMARLHLERAALLEAGHDAMMHNLYIARELIELSQLRPGRQTVVPREEDLSIWRTATAYDPQTLPWGLVLTLWLALAAALASRRVSRPALRHTLVALTISGVLLAAGLLVADRIRSRVIATYDVAIIVSSHPELRQGPSSHAGVISDAVYPGMMVRIAEERRDWTQVLLDGGRLGWIPAAAVVRVRP